jgi:hypothetical protein
VEIASVAAPTTIVDSVGAAVLFGEHMLDMKVRRRRSKVGEVTVFTAAAGPIADKLAKGP